LSSTAVVALGLAAALGCAIALPAAAATKAGRALPDSVVVRLPHRDLTLLDVQMAWARQAPRYRPTGEGLALRRTFVEQLVEKEVLARAALAEPFVATEAESAVYLTERARALSERHYAHLVFDSLEVLPADWENARRAIADSSDTTGLAANARRSAVFRREQIVSERVRADLAPVWDDSVAALLAREFAKLPPLRRQEGDRFMVRVTNQVPAFAPADTGRALVTARGDRISVAGFLLRFQGIPPTERDYPITPGQVKARAEQFLGAAWVLRQAEAAGVANDPEVRRRLAEKRESMALDHWYERNVAARIDTSEGALRAFYAKDPEAYAVPAHAVLHYASFGDSTEADSLARAVSSGTKWDDWCARFGSGDTRDACRRVRNVFPGDADTALVQTVAGLAPGAVWTRAQSRLRGREYQVWQLYERVDHRVRPFEEARSFVARSLASLQLEERLQERLKALKAATPARWNEKALARLDLGSETGGAGR
jgi:hypothetical protein